MRTVPDPTPPIHHHVPFHFPPSPPPSADATAPSSPLPVPDTPRRHIHAPRDLQTARKVADSLQLFRESEERPTSGPALAKRRFTTSHPNDSVEEARYEFVKRADWPDPETAALRRERSSTALESIRTRESIDSQARGDPVTLFPRPLPRDPPFSDPSHWRNDTTIRGRRRRRASDVTPREPQPSSPESSPISVPQSPCIRPHSRAYPPSPSPSRSPTDRIPPLALYNSSVDVTDESCLPESSETYLTNLNRPHLRSPTPTHILPHASPIASHPMLPSPTRSFSPWSTDDESAWETSSMISDISTSSGTSEHPLSFSHVVDASIDPVDEGDKIRASLAYKVEDDAGSYGSNLWNADSLNMVYGDSEESLPHIPLRPFRNQVGGHNAIYKFTKRAVCKVSICVRAMALS